MRVQGKVVVFSGTLTMKRAEAKQIAEDAGATVTGSVSGNTDIIVVGPGSENNSKVLSAKAKGVTVWTEKQFVAALKGTTKASNKRKAQEIDEEEEKPKKKTAARGKKAAAKKAKKVEKEEGEDEEEEEEEEPKKKTASKGKKAAAKKVKKVEEDEDEEEAAEPEPKKKSTTRGKKSRKVSEDEAEEAQVEVETESAAPERTSELLDPTLSEDEITALIKKGANFKQEDEKGRTLLHMAAKRGILPACAALLKAGLDANVMSNNRTPLLFVAKSKTPKAGIVPLLLKFGADVNAGEVKPLWKAANMDVHGWKLAGKVDNSDVVEALIAGGADVNCKDIFGNTALHRAVHSGNISVTKLLLKHGANINQPNCAGMTTALIVADNIQPHAHLIAKVLIMNGADLSIACKYPDSKTILLLPLDQYHKGNNAAEESGKN